MKGKEIMKTPKHTTNTPAAFKIINFVLHKIAGFIGKCIESAYWIFRLTLTHSSNLRQSTVRKHPVLFKIHDFSIITIGFYAAWCILACYGIIAQSTSAGWAFLHDVIASLRYAIRGFGLIIAMMNFNPLDEEYYDDYDENEYDEYNESNDKIIDFDTFHSRHATKHAKRNFHFITLNKDAWNDNDNDENHKVQMK